MRDGSSIMNMLNGDAEKSMFTMSNMRTGADDEQKRRANDVTLLMLNPYSRPAPWRSSSGKWAANCGRAGSRSVRTCSRG